MMGEKNSRQIAWIGSIAKQFAYYSYIQKAPLNAGFLFGYFGFSPVSLQ
jgi:hypothetical protein